MGDGRAPSELDRQLSQDMADVEPVGLKRTAEEAVDVADGGMEVSAVSEYKDQVSEYEGLVINNINRDLRRLGRASFDVSGMDMRAVNDVVSEVFCKDRFTSSV